jgi:hypothetical protein
MNANKEEWLNEVMSSTREKAPVSANPFLYQQVMFKVQQQKIAGKVGNAFVYKWAAVLLLLVGVNGATITRTLTHRQIDGSAAYAQVIFTEMVTQTSYNY